MNILANSKGGKCLSTEYIKCTPNWNGNVAKALDGLLTKTRFKAVIGVNHVIMKDVFKITFKGIRFISC